MKTRNFITGILCLLVMSNALGQEELTHGDTIVFEVGDRLILRIKAKDYAHLKRGLDVSQVIYDFQKNLKQVSSNLPEVASYRIHYNHKASLEFEETQVLNKYKVANNQVMPLTLKNKCYITAEAFSIDIDFNDQQDLLDPGLPEAVKSIVKQLPEKHRFLTTLRYESEDFGGPPVLKEERRDMTHLDMLSLNAGVGANIIYNRYLTDLTGEVALHLARKGIMKNQFYISNNLLFDFDPERQVVLNNLTSIGYRRNFSQNKEKPEWLGLEFGTLTSRTGDFFPQNTFRVGVNWQLVKNINVMSSLYFNGFFNQVSPGIRIGIGI